MQWICQICNYIHEDEDPPEGCPVCGAPANKFRESYDDDTFGSDSGRNQDDMDDFERDLFADYDDE